MSAYAVYSRTFVVVFKMETDTNMDTIYVAHGLETRIQNTMSRYYTELVVKVIVKQYDLFIVVEGL